MAGKLTVRPLASADLQRYAVLADEHGSLFDSPRWTALFGPRLQRHGVYDEGGELRGGLSLYTEQRFGLRFLRNPPFTREVGPFFAPRATNPAARSHEQRALMDAVAACVAAQEAAVVSLGLSPKAIDCLPFYWRRYKVVPHYTYRIDLTESEDAIKQAMSPERRNDVRKAIKDGVEASESQDVRTLEALVLGSFARKDKAFPRAELGAILAAFPPGDSSYCFVARHGGRAVAAVYVVTDRRTAYYLLGGYAEGAHHGAGPLVLHHAIQKAKSLGLQVFDFEGSVVPSIEKYFRGFGGALTPIFSVHRAWLPLELGLKLVRREIF